MNNIILGRCNAFRSCKTQLLHIHIMFKKSTVRDNRNPGHRELGHSRKCTCYTTQSIIFWPPPPPTLTLEIVMHEPTSSKVGIG